MATETHSQFFKTKFDVILLTFLFLTLLGVVVHMAHDIKDADQIAWARESAGTVLGGLLGLITGYRLARAGDGPNPQSPPENAPQKAVEGGNQGLES